MEKVRTTITDELKQNKESLREGIKCCLREVIKEELQEKNTMSFSLPVLECEIKQENTNDTTDSTIEIENVYSLKEENPVTEDARCVQNPMINEHKPVAYGQTSINALATFNDNDLAEYDINIDFSTRSITNHAKKAQDQSLTPKVSVFRITIKVFFHYQSTPVVLTRAQFQRSPVLPDFHQNW